jgi:hypothetical protein
MKCSIFWDTSPTESNAAIKENGRRVKGKGKNKARNRKAKEGKGERK